MDNKVLIALIDSLVNEAISKLVIPEGIRGPRGLKGKDGNDFDLLQHEETIRNFVLENLPTKIELTEDQREELRGPRGHDGKDFSMEVLVSEVSRAVNEISDSLKLKFSDLSEEEVSSLKLKFEDLTPEDISLLRGPRGQKGKPGKDFSPEEVRPIIEEYVADSVMALAPDLKLKFSDLSEEEVESLKLKFEDLSDDERLSLRGPRGQKGKQGTQGIQGERGRDGLDGKNGQDGKMGPRGMPGLQGLTGPQGIVGPQGEDGKDAPRISDITVDQDIKNQEFSLNFEFEDGTEIEAGPIKLPKGDTTFYYPSGFNSGGGGGAGTPGDSAYEVAVNNGFVGTEQDWLDSLVGPQGPAGTNGTDGADGLSAYEVAVNNGFVGTEQDWLDSLVGPQGPPGAGGSLEILDEYVPVSNQVTSINFIGEYVTVRPRTYMDEWNLLSDVIPSLIDYDPGNDPEVDVYIDAIDPSIIKDVDCDPSVFVGAFVRMTNLGVAVNALADTYENSNVIGVVESKPSSAKCVIRVSGKTSSIFTGLDTALDYFLSSTVAGEKSDTVPVVSGSIKLKLGQAFSSSSFLLAKGERVVRL